MYTRILYIIMHRVTCIGIYKRVNYVHRAGHKHVNIVHRAQAGRKGFRSGEAVSMYPHKVECIA